MQWLGGDEDQENIIGFGLGIEPNLFTAYFYGDLQAEELLGFKQYTAPDKAFLSDISGIHVIYALGFDTPWTLLPLPHFDPADCSSYLPFTTTATESTQVSWNELIAVDMALIFGYPERWNSFLHILPGIEIKHGLGALIALHKRLAGENSDAIALLHLAGKQATLLIGDGKKLLFANTITFDHLEDIRYFFFYTFQQLSIGNETETYLIGEASTHLGLQQMLAPYLRQLRTTLPPNLVSATTSNPSISATHWLGLTAATCVL